MIVREPIKTEQRFNFRQSISRRVGEKIDTKLSIQMEMRYYDLRVLMACVVFQKPHDLLVTIFIENHHFTVVAVVKTFASCIFTLKVFGFEVI